MLSVYFASVSNNSLAFTAITVEGVPQPFNANATDPKLNHIVPSELLSEDQWLKHLEKLKIFTLVANLRGDPSPDENKLNGNVLGIDNGKLMELKIEPMVVQVKSSPVIENHAVTDGKSDSIKSDKNKDDSVINDKTLKNEKKSPPQITPLKLTPENEVNEDIKTKLKEINDLVKATEPCKEKVLGKPIDTGNSKPPANTSRQNGAHRPLLRRSKGSLLASKPPNVLVYSDSNVTRNNVIETLKIILDREM